MKQIVFYAVAASLLLGSGCKKKEDGSTEMMSKEEVAEKTQEMAVQATEKAEAVTEQAEAATKAAVQKTEAAVSALTVKAEDVMADLNQSVEQVKEKVSSFDKTQLLAYVDQYKTVILEKKDQIAALTEQVKALPVTELMGEKAKALKEQLSNYGGELDALKDRYAVYLGKLKTLGGPSGE